LIRNVYLSASANKKTIPMNLRNSKIINNPYSTASTYTAAYSQESQTTNLPSTMSHAEEDDNVHEEEERAPNPSCLSTEHKDADLQRMMTIMQTIAINDSSFTPKSFKGEDKDTEKTEKWLEYFENYTSFRGIDETTKLKLFKILLTGQAAEWIRSLPNNITDTLPTLITEFQRRFSVTDITRWQKATSMWTRQQGATEPVDVYITDIINMAKIVPVTDKELIRFALIKGFKIP
jgi:Retrotransposon gag protein